MKDKDPEFRWREYIERETERANRERGYEKNPETGEYEDVLTPEGRKLMNEFLSKRKADADKLMDTLGFLGNFENN